MPCDHTGSEILNSYTKSSKPFKKSKGIKGQSSKSKGASKVKAY